MEYQIDCHCMVFYIQPIAGIIAITINRQRFILDAIVNKKPHAVTASFVLPSLIERGLVISLQNKLLDKGLCRIQEKSDTKIVFDACEKEYIEAFLNYKSSFQFNAKESYVMGKMYALFVSEEVLEPSMDNEMILTGVGHNKGRRLDRTLGALIKSDFAKKEILSEYMKIIDIIFCKLNIRNCIMHGLGETFDYLNIGIVAIMFQLLWDVAACEIFND
mgnify:CR=1 FL=1